MRKIYLLASILFFSLNIVNAQIDKNQKLLMGNIALSIGKSKDDTFSTQKQFFILFSPGFGKAIKKNLVLGYKASIGYNNSLYETSREKVSMNGWTAGGGVFLRKYFPLSKTFSFSADLGAGFLHADHKSENNNLLTGSTTFTSNRSNEVTLGVSTALVYAFNKKWLANLALNDFAQFYFRKQSRETNITGTTTKQKYSQVGFESQFGYLKSLSTITLGFCYVW